MIPPLLDLMDQKPCTQCGVIKPRSGFYAFKSDRHAHVSAACRECLKERSRAYSRAHPEANRARATEWQRRYPKRTNRKQRDWLARNPEQKLKKLESGHRRRVRESQQATGIVDFEAILRRDGLRCYFCGRKVKREDVHFDHVWPISRGGPHEEWNIAVTHSRCNLKKGAKPLAHFPRFAYMFHDTPEVSI